MIKRIFTIIGLIIAIGLIGGFKGCKNSTPKGTVLTVFSDTRQFTARNNVMIASKSGVSNEFLTAVDDSMDIFRADIARNPLWNSHNIAPELVIIYALHNCVNSPESQTPSFRIRADDYDGTVFDQNPKQGIGEILAAEYVIQDIYNGVYVLTNEWVVCSISSGQAVSRIYAKRVARYGYEHKFLFDWFPAEYERTKNHAASGISHPLIETNDGESLMALDFKPKDVFALGGNANGRTKR